MQKKLIALAVAGLVSGSAFAQSNVTIAGIVDLGYRHSSGTGLSKSGIDHGGDSGSRLIFKGTEALGNGVTALFNLEYGLNPDENVGVGTKAASGANARQTFVGLTGDFGTVVAGRLQPMAKGVSDKYDTMASMWFSPVNSLDKASGTTINNGIRLSNAVAYVSPKMAGGLTAQLAYSFAGASELDGNAYSGDAERILGVGLDYDNGPVGLSLIYHRANDLNNVSGVDARDMLVGGSYDFGAAKVVASWQSVKRDPADTSDKIYQLGVQVPVSAAGKVYVGYANYNKDKSSNDAKSFAVGYKHAMSKRTNFYAGYQRVANDGAASIAVFGNTGANVGGGKNSSGYGMGVKHSF